MTGARAILSDLRTTPQKIRAMVVDGSGILRESPSLAVAIVAVAAFYAFLVR